MCILQMKVDLTRKEPRVPALLTRHSATLCQRWCLQTCPQVSPDILLPVQISIGGLECLLNIGLFSGGQSDAHVLKQVVELNYSLFCKD